MVPTNENIGVEDLDIGTEEMTGPETSQAGVELTDEITDLESGIGLMGNQADVLDTAADSVEQITEVQDTIAADENAPVTETEIAVMESFSRSIMHTLGLPDVVLTTESRSNLSRSEIIATMESQKQGIISKIVAAMKSLMDMVAGFVKRIIENRTLLGRYLSSLQKKIVNHKDQGGKVPSKFKDATSVLKALDSSEKLINISDRAVSEFKSIEKTTELGFDDLANSVKVIQTTDYSHGIGNPEMAGGGLLQFKKDDKVKIYVDTPSAPVTEGDRLSSQDCAKVIQLAMKVLGSLKKMESVGNRIVQFGKSMANKLSVMLNAHATARHEKAGNLDKAEESATRAMGRLAANAYRDLALNFGATVPSLAFKNIKAAADYVKASIA